METISVSITTFNEQDNIEACLESLQGLADEIVVVDGKSKDKTLQIARKYSKKVYIQPNHPNLNLNKNYGFSKASGDWILCLDADEQVTPELAAAIRRILSEGTEYDGFLLPRKNYYFGRWLRYGGNYPDFQLRLFRRVKGKFPAQHVHERLEVQGTVGRFTAAMAHFPYKDINQYFHKFNFYTSFEGRFLFEKGERVRAGNACWLFFGKHFFKGLRRYILKAGFVDGWQGFLACLFTFFTGVVSYGKLWERQQSNRSNVQGVQNVKNLGA